MEYSAIVRSIGEACNTIHLEYRDTADIADGRLVSAQKETPYLRALADYFQTHHPDIPVHIPVSRAWRDIEIGTIPINLKLTTGATDNAFNKIALLSTLCGRIPASSNITFNRLLELIREWGILTTRNPFTEYHYLVVHKRTEQVLFKSILDITAYKSNPCNILQINWASEFENASTFTSEDQYQAKVQSLLGTIKESLRKDIAHKQDWLTAEF